MILVGLSSFFLIYPPLGLCWIETRLRGPGIPKAHGGFIELYSALSPGRENELNTQGRKFVHETRFRGRIGRCLVFCLYLWGIEQTCSRLGKARPRASLTKSVCKDAIVSASELGGSIQPCTWVQQNLGVRHYLTGECLLTNAGYCGPHHT